MPDLNSEDNCTVQTRPSGFGELRQRNVMNGVSGEMASDESVSSKKDDNVMEEEVPKIWRAINEMKSEQDKMESSGRKLEKDGTLDLKNLMAGDPNCKLVLLIPIVRM